MAHGHMTTHFCSGHALAIHPPPPKNLLRGRTPQSAKTPRNAKRNHMYCFLLPWGGFAAQHALEAPPVRQPCTRHMREGSSTVGMPQRLRQDRKKQRATRRHRASTLDALGKCLPGRSGTVWPPNARTQERNPHNKSTDLQNATAQNMPTVHILKRSLL